MDFARAVRVVRAARGMTQKELAASARLDPSYISLLETGKRNPSLSIIEDIASALDVPLHVLMLFGADDHDLRSGGSDEAMKLGEHLLAVLSRGTGRVQRHDVTTAEAGSGSGRRRASARHGTRRPDENRGES
jgi:transcriptional regulator with XRE-family HTH domain